MADVDKIMVKLLVEEYELNGCRLSKLLQEDRLDYVEIDKLIKTNDKIIELIKGFEEVR